MHKTLSIAIVATSVLFAGIAQADTVTRATTNVKIKDVFAWETVHDPKRVKICEDRVVSGDKTGDTLAGAIIGGLIGNNLLKGDNAGAAGAVIGGIIGHNNSDAKGGTVKNCRTETQYTKTERKVYKHSIAVFKYNGREYRVQFQK